MSMLLFDWYSVVDDTVTRHTMGHDGLLSRWMSSVEVTPLEDVEDTTCVSDRGVR